MRPNYYEGDAGGPYGPPSGGSVPQRPAPNAQPGLPGVNAPAAGPAQPPGRPQPTAGAGGGLPEGVDQAWWGRAQRILGDKAGSSEDLKDPKHRAWLNKQLKKNRQKKVGGGPQTGGPDPPAPTGGPDPPGGGPQTGGPDPPPGGPTPPGGTTMTGWGGKSVTQNPGGGYTPTNPAGYPGSPNYPQPGQGFPLPGAPGGPTGPGAPGGTETGRWTGPPDPGGPGSWPGGSPPGTETGRWTGPPPQYPPGDPRARRPQTRWPEWGPGGPTQVDPRMAYNAQTGRTI